jgi:hypothetical protein
VLGSIARGEVVSDFFFFFNKLSLMHSGFFKDIGDTASYNKISRHDEFDSYHHSYRFEYEISQLVT